jgi:hypothetical protein
MANYSASYPVKDIYFAGVQLPAAEPVVISFAAANNDPALLKQRRSGNRGHLAWSAGEHACPAQQHARLIASVAIEKLLDRLPDMQLAVAVDELVWRPGPFHRALTALPVRFTPVTVPVQPHQTPGDSRWKVHNWTQPMESSPPETADETITLSLHPRPHRPRHSRRGRPAAPDTVARHWWSPLAKWWHGR